MNNWNKYFIKDVLLVSIVSTIGFVYSISEMAKLWFNYIFNPMQLMLVAICLFIILMIVFIFVGRV